ncbi:MAG: methyltransferase domain-containing protein [Acidimicrobiales bacterium]|nr:methyltransferase domain-containing protein [Acidimicrobiales bacterium]
MSGPVEWLPDAPGTDRDLPVFGSTHPMRDVTRRVAFDREWNAETRARVADMFNSMAPAWHADHDTPARRAAIADALERGAVIPGPILELGSGSGVGTQELVDHGWTPVVMDLAIEMLRHAPDGLAPKVQGDASALPFRSGAAPALLLVNMLLFPDEVDRVLAADGPLIWVNTLAEETPIHLPAQDVVAALPGSWTATAGRAGTGAWCVARRV